jgi:DNA-binding NarL/FixJ family response regulator
MPGMDGVALIAALRAARRQDFPGAELLSVRERQIAEMVAAGAANREVAARLSLTEGTVKNHVSAVLRKLGLRDRTRLAIHMGGR